MFQLKFRFYFIYLFYFTEENHLSDPAIDMRSPGKH